jgi:hypothetical protein
MWKISKYFGKKVTNQTLVHEEIKSRLISGNACYHSVQNFLPSRLLSKIYNVALALYGFEPRSLTLGQDTSMRMTEKGVYRRIFGLKWRLEKIV